ncbi:MAG: host attachment protein [Chloroflexi bacterium]|nr:host attachment protein [Chloroflexota bacterium]
MFNQKDLRGLAKYQAETLILSVYLDVDPTERKMDEYKLALRQMLKQAHDGLAAAEDVAAVQRFFDHEYDWSGRGVVVFACAQEEFWRVYSLAVPVASGVTVARKPYIWPLAALVDAYGNYVVVQVDRQGVRLLLFEMGELQTASGYLGEEVRKLKKGRGSSGGAGRRGGVPVSSRRGEEAAQRNIREAIKATKRFCRKHKPQRLIIAGTDPMVAQFREALPKPLRETVIGSFGADMNASESEMRDRSLEILQQVEKEREKALVEAVFTVAAKGRGGAIRLADTLGAAHEGRIQTLVVARDYHQSGYQCCNCAYITDQPLQVCPFCGGEFAEIPDAAEALVTKVIEDGGKVEVVDDHPKIAEFGVGALLRY